MVASSSSWGTPMGLLGFAAMLYLLVTIIGNHAALVVLMTGCYAAECVRHELTRIVPIGGKDRQRLFLYVDVFGRFTSIDIQ